jgi:small conductance mechanosensitive channel
MNAEKIYSISLKWMESNGPSIFIAIIVFFLGQWAIRIIRKMLRAAMDKREISASLRPFLQSLVITSLQILLIILILQILSVHLTIFTAIVTSFGVAAGLALSGTLQNFTAGVLILLLKPFRVGDNIIAQNHDGVVDSIEIFYTIITTADNRTVIIPNSKLANEVIVNISRQGSRRLDIDLKFTYAEDFSRVQKTIYRSLKATDGALPSPEPFVEISNLETDGFKVTSHVWIAAAAYQEARFQVQKRIIEDLKTAGFKLPGM